MTPNLLLLPAWRPKTWSWAKHRCIVEHLNGNVLLPAKSMGIPTLFSPHDDFQWFPNGERPSVLGLARSHKSVWVVAQRGSPTTKNDLKLPRKAGVNPNKSGASVKWCTCMSNNGEKWIDIQYLRWIGKIDWKRLPSHTSLSYRSIQSQWRVQDQELQHIHAAPTIK